MTVRTRATLNHANLTIINIDSELKTRCEHYGEKDPKFSLQLEHLLKQTLSRLLRWKIGDCRAPSTCVGYSHDHDGDYYCTFSPKTKWVTEMRDVIWLKWMSCQKWDTKKMWGRPVTWPSSRVQKWKLRMSLMNPWWRFRCFHDTGSREEKGIYGQKGSKSLISPPLKCLMDEMDNTPVKMYYYASSTE